MVNYIAIAIPVFFLLIGIEVLVSRWQGKNVYRFHDAVTDLGCGIGQQVTGLFMKALLFGGYFLVYERWGLFELSATSPWTWLIALVSVDFLYYWWHRLSHVVNVMWAAHIVHHQSEDMNFAVALRQAWFTSATSWVFYLSLAVVGIPPYVFLAADAFSTLYQFWIHTETIGKLGPLEWVLNTPSHHRVHHAINPEYIDRNYGAVLIVWDRLFGSFAEEHEAPVYGIVEPFASWNPIWANFHYWAEILAKARRAGSWRDRLLVWLAPPGWEPASGEMKTAPPVRREEYEKFDTEIPAGLNAYVAAHFVPIAVATFALVMWQDALGQPLAIVGALLVLASVGIWGGLFEARSWALLAEAGRLVAIGAGAGALAVFGWVPLLAATALILASTGSLAWVLRYRDVFQPAAPSPAPS